MTEPTIDFSKEIQDLYLGCTVAIPDSEKIRATTFNNFNIAVSRIVEVAYNKGKIDMATLFSETLNGSI